MQKLVKIFQITKKRANIVDARKRISYLRNQSHEFYKNKLRRLLAMEELVKIIKKTKKRSTVADVRRRIHNLQGTYRSAVKKMEENIRKGRTFIPKSWKCHELRFLDNRNATEREVSK